LISEALLQLKRKEEARKVDNMVGGKRKMDVVGEEEVGEREGREEKIGNEER
jgi:hypothetical protein